VSQLFPWLNETKNHDVNPVDGFKWAGDDMQLHKICNEFKELQNYQAYLSNAVNVEKVDAVLFDRNDSGLDGTTDTSGKKSKSKRKKVITEEFIMRKSPLVSAIHETKDSSRYSSLICEMLNRGDKKQLSRFIESSCASICKLVAVKFLPVDASEFAEHETTQSTTKEEFVVEGANGIISFVNRLIDSIPDGVYLINQLTYQKMLTGSTSVCEVSLNGTMTAPIINPTATRAFKYINANGSLAISIDEYEMMSGFHLQWTSM
jgi:hypothetical protein